ncbi:MAG: hypothetical protein AAFY56_03705 [Pseudomonadota bacterium]
MSAATPITDALPETGGYGRKINMFSGFFAGSILHRFALTASG